MPVSRTSVLFSAHSASLGWHLTGSWAPCPIPAHPQALRCSCPGSRAGRLQTKPPATQLWPTPCQGPVQGTGPQSSALPLTSGTTSGRVILWVTGAGVRCAGIESGTYLASAPYTLATVMRQRVTVSQGPSDPNCSIR